MRNETRVFKTKFTLLKNPIQISTTALMNFNACNISVLITLTSATASSSAASSNSFYEYVIKICFSHVISYLYQHRHWLSLIHQCSLVACTMKCSIRFKCWNEQFERVVTSESYFKCRRVNEVSAISYCFNSQPSSRTYFSRKAWNGRKQRGGRRKILANTFSQVSQ